jgi:hypothetical protein
MCVRVCVCVQRRTCKAGISYRRDQESLNLGVEAVDHPFGGLSIVFPDRCDASAAWCVHLLCLRPLDGNHFVLRRFQLLP